MENNIPTSEYKEIIRDMAKDYIALNFKGLEYSSVILFVEVLLDKLKEDLQNSDSPFIKDIFGR